MRLQRKYFLPFEKKKKFSLKMTAWTCPTLKLGYSLIGEVSMDLSNEGDYSYTSNKFVIKGD